MPKFFSPAFPPRRPSGIVRYILVVGILLTLVYFHTSYSETPRAGTTPLGAPDPLAHPPGDRPPADSRPGYFDPSDEDASLPHTLPGSSKSDAKAGTEPATKPEPKPDRHSSQSPPSDSGKDKGTSGPGYSHATGPEDAHPIDRLIYDAQHTFAELTSKQSNTIEEAAQAYRKRRGRHPPPGFDRWFEFAQSKNSIIVEDFFDQAYHDLQPFWGIAPASLRKESWDFEMTIHVRDGNATSGSDWFWTVIWLDLIRTIQHLLPDMDIALNAMDEPRIITPWEDIEQYMKKAAATVNLPDAKKVRNDFQKLPEPGKGDLMTETREKVFEGTSPYWSLVRRGCPPDSLARTQPMQQSFAAPPSINMSNAEPHLYEGYVYNYTLSTDVCHQPDLQGLQGILIEPLSTSTTKTLFPMFGGSKLGVNNEILLPAPMYWNEEERFTGGDDHGVPWDQKSTSAIWRGVATGGKNRESNWRGFQRHRFVSMNNGTKISSAEKGIHEPENFALPETQYSVHAQIDDSLGAWVSDWADVAFVDLSCEPPEPEGTCFYTDHYFERKLGMPMSDQFDSKYLPDLDGNSFSGRYLGFLRSTSLPIKATLWHEWHDSRLVPWKHFVPMDNRYGDYYGIMDYFIGYNGSGGHDRAAEKIAAEGKEWADKVLRKEDMQIYTLRLLLEYARLLDDRRETLGWVEDVLKNPQLQKTWSSWW